MSATAGNGSASVAFTAPSSNGSAITGYTVTATDTTTPAHGGQTASGATSPITVSGLTNGDTYTFTVTATNGDGTGAASSASSPVTPSTVPGAPTAVSATAGNGSASVAFTAPSSNGSAITSYTVTATDTTTPAHGGQTASGATSPITVGGLTDGDAYTFTVKATNGDGTGAASGASNSVVPSSNSATITSASSTSVAAGKRLTFSITTGGTPKPAVTAAGLPTWVTFTPGTSKAKVGTAKITGTAPTSGGVYSFTIHANNGSGPDTTQVFTISVFAITSSPAASFTKGTAGTYTVRTIGGANPGTAITATLPAHLAGLTFHDNDNGTATLSGTPASTAKTATVTVKAVSGTLSVTQKLTVTIG